MTPFKYGCDGVIYYYTIPEIDRFKSSNDCFEGESVATPVRGEPESSTGSHSRS